MNLQKFLILVLILAVTAVGCRKVNDEPKPSDNLTMNDLVIADDFNWSTSTDISLKVGVETTQPMTLKSKISVFNGDPAENGKLLTSGAASPQKQFEATLRVPASLSDVYLMAEFPFGLTKVEKVAVSNLINFTFDDFVDNGNLKSTPNFKSTTDVGPACDDCDVYMTGSGSYNIGNGQKYCVAENETFTGSVTFQGWNGGGTLQICGTATINSLTLPNSSHLIITQNGSLTLGSFSSYSSPNSVIIYENASVTINNSIQTQGTSFENQGVLNINGNLTAQQLSNGFLNSGELNVTGILSVSGITFTNDGTINHSGTDFNINNSTDFLNTGTIFLNRPAGANFNLNIGTVTNNNLIDVIGNINHNAAVDLINNCSMICTGNFAVNTGGTVQNYSGYIRANFLDINTNASLLLNDKSMISVTTLTRNNNATITGSGELNTVLVSGNTTFNNNGPTISGTIEFATDNINLAPAAIPSHFVNGATLVGLDFITNSIPAGPCNPEGIGPQIVDTDGDGVPDEFDDFPNDEYRAFNYQFPEPGGHITLMFEDLWPGTGDYDFNDLVIGVSGTEVTNADNDVVETYINLDVKAVGAGLKNGFGWQYANIPPSAIEQVTGMVLSESSNIVLNPNGTEAAQDSAVIIAIENVEDVLNRVGGSMYNTVDNGNVGVSDPVIIHVLFGETTPLPRELFDGEIYNIFLIKNQQRGTEIHQADRQPTNLMTYPWGESNDTSDPLIGRYYKTASNLPWAMIVYDNFQWPLEGVPIIEAYPDFASWAQTGGSTESNWYDNPDFNKIWNE